MTIRGKKKILVHTCCASCAAYVVDELEKKEFIPILYFYNPEISDEGEYDQRLSSLEEFADEKGIELIHSHYFPGFISEMMKPYSTTSSLKYINDLERFRRKRCNMCLTELINKTRKEAEKRMIKYFTTTFLCSPFKPHSEISAIADSLSGGPQFVYQDFRKGYWKGRNIGKNRDYFIPKYCGCDDSKEEGRLE